VVHGDIDETAVPLLDEYPGKGPCDEEIAGQVRRNDVGESCGIDLEERLRLGQEAGIDRPHPDARVVHDQVDPAQARVRRRHSCRHRLRLAHVDGKRLRSQAAGPVQRHQFRQPRRRPRRDGDRGAGPNAAY